MFPFFPRRSYSIQHDHQLVRNLVAHGDEGEGNWRGNWRMEWVASILTPPPNVDYPALLKLMRTPRLPAVDWTDAPTDLNGQIRFGERRVWFLRVCHHVPHMLYTKNTILLQTGLSVSSRRTVLLSGPLMVSNQHPDASCRITGVASLSTSLPLLSSKPDYSWEIKEQIFKWCHTHTHTSPNPSSSSFSSSFPALSCTHSRFKD